MEIKAKRIQFLNKINKSAEGTSETETDVAVDEEIVEEKESTDFTDNSFDKFLSDEESDLLSGDK